MGWLLVPGYLGFLGHLIPVHLLILFRLFGSECFSGLTFRVYVAYKIKLFRLSDNLSVRPKSRFC